MISGKIRSAHEEQGFIWLHADTKTGARWFCIEKKVFKNIIEPELLNGFKKHNKKIKKEIIRLQARSKAAKDPEYEKANDEKIRKLKEEIKEEILMHDLTGKKLDLKIG